MLVVLSGGVLWARACAARGLVGAVESYVVDVKLSWPFSESFAVACSVFFLSPLLVFSSPPLPPTACPRHVELRRPSTNGIRYSGTGSLRVAFCPQAGVQYRQHLPVPPAPGARLHSVSPAPPSRGTRRCWCTAPLPEAGALTLLPPHPCPPPPAPPPAPDAPAAPAAAAPPPPPPGPAAAARR